MSRARLRVELAASIPFAVVLMALHAAAAACVLAVMPGAAGWLLAALFALLGMASAWSRALGRSPSSVRALEVSGAGLEVELASGVRFAAQAAERRYVGRVLVLLPLRRPVRRTIVVTRDMADADSFRRLRIWALWGRLPPVAAKQLPA